MITPLRRQALIRGLLFPEATILPKELQDATRASISTEPNRAVLLVRRYIFAELL